MWALTCVQCENHLSKDPLWAATMYKSYKQATPFAASAAAQTAPTVNFNTAAPAANGSAARVICGCR